MANWKKIIVSGSNISQLNNDSEYLKSTGTINSASIAERATTLSIDATASFAVVAATSRLSDSASVAYRATTLSEEATASYALYAVTASHALNVPSTSSHALSAVSASIADEISQLATSSFAILSSNSRTSDSSSVAVRATTLSVDATASFADVAGLARGVEANSITLGTDTTGNYIAALGVGTGVSIASNGGEGSTPTITVDYGSSPNNAVEGNTTLTLQGTTNEISISGGNITLGSGGTATIGLPSNVKISNNLIVSGDLTVNGTTTSINTQNIFIEDKLILLNSGSINPDGGGIVIDGGNGIGHAFIFNSDSSRFGFTASLDSTSNSIIPDAFSAAVIDEISGHSDIAEYQKSGNIKVSSNGDIFIFS